MSILPPMISIYAPVLLHARPSCHIVEAAADEVRIAHKTVTTALYPDLSARLPCVHGVLLLFAIIKSAANLGP